MYCPFCNETDTRVIDSRLVSDGRRVRRRRECLTCAERFTSFEEPELLMPRMIKQGGRREPFNEEKLKNGLLKSLEKRPVSIEQIDAVLDRLLQRLRSTGEREISSRTLGDWVMEELRELDEVGYVRFASVYHRFQYLTDFRDEVNRLEKNTNAEDTEVKTDRVSDE